VMSSGEPQTHPGLAEACENQEQAAVELTDNFVCAGGVNVTTLLRATRMSLLEHVEPLGANALLEEQCVPDALSPMSHVLNASHFFCSPRWECKIAKPKPAHRGPYKVRVSQHSPTFCSVYRRPL
jgi:hypothetical protein